MKIATKGISPLRILMALHDAASPQGLGVLQDILNPLTEEEAATALADSKDGYIDYLNGRPLKIDLSLNKVNSEEGIDVARYDRDAGEGAALTALSHLLFALSYDTETTGLPLWKERSHHPDQPHLIQIGGVVISVVSGQTLERFETLIKPDGWVIPDGVVELTGITNEHALEHGIPEKDAIDQFLEFRKDYLRIAHNQNFDQRIVRIALERFDYSEEAKKAWSRKDDHECSMRLTQKAIGGKVMKLSKALAQLCDHDLEGAHTALADAEGAAMLWLKLREMRAAI